MKLIEPYSPIPVAPTAVHAQAPHASGLVNSIKSCLTFYRATKPLPHCKVLSLLLVLSCLINNFYLNVPPLPLHLALPRRRGHCLLGYRHHLAWGRGLGDDAVMLRALLHAGAGEAGASVSRSVFLRPCPPYRNQKTGRPVRVQVRSFLFFIF